ncbi:MAG: hypothetical protein CR974_02940 [Gammaproteobacteria bacterium]|nr:MAG: hypothetical protein CR974_02940 [Gammaproteobacteria bacterium]
MTHTLNLIKNGATQGHYTIGNGQQATVSVDREMQIQLLDDNGVLVSSPKTKMVGDDLWVFLDEAAKDPDVILTGYASLQPIEDTGLLSQLNSTFALSGDLDYRAALASAEASRDILLANEVQGLAATGAPTAMPVAPATASVPTAGLAPASEVATTGAVSATEVAATEAASAVSAAEAAGTASTVSAVEAAGTASTVSAAEAAGAVSAAEVATATATGAAASSFPIGIIAGVGAVAVGVAAAAGGGGGDDDDAPEAPKDTTINKPTLVFDTVAGDDVINASESQQDSLTITGNLSQLDSDIDASKTQVTLSVNGKDYQATVNGDTFSAEVKTADLAKATSLSGIAHVTDTHGNNAQSDTVVKPYQLDTAVSAASIETIDAITGDNLLNQQELQAGTINITGTIAGIQSDESAQVTVSVDGKTFSAAVTGTTFSVPVDSAALQNATQISVSAEVSDDHGNRSVSAAKTHDYQVDATLDAPTITIDDLSADNVLSGKELAASAEQTVTGRLSNLSADIDSAKTAVTLSVGGQTYTATLNGDSFSAQIPSDVLAGAQVIDASVSVTDSSGNTASASSQKTYTVDNSVSQPAVILDAITGDDVINIADVTGDKLTLSGGLQDVDSDVVGKTVTLKVGQATYDNISVNADNRFSVEVAVKDLEKADSVSAEATVTDKYDNSATSEPASRPYTLDLAINKPTITLDVIAGDGIINQGELQNGVTVNGQIKGIDSDVTERLVTLKVGSETYTQVITGDTFAIDVPDSTSLQSGTQMTATISVTDASGNAITSDAATQTYAVNTSIDVPMLALDPIAGDGVLDYVERVQKTQTLTGKLDKLDADLATAKVTVSIAGNDYDATVSGKTFSVDVPTAVLAGASQVSATVSVTDTAGNVVMQQATQDYIVSAAPVITFDAIAGDNVINAQEAKQPVTISGQVSDLNAAVPLTITVGDQSYSTTVDAKTGQFSVAIDGETLAKHQKITAELTNAGIVTSGSADYRVDTDLSASISIDDINAGKVVNAATAAAGVTLSGKYSYDSQDVNSDDVTVTIKVAGKDYTPTLDNGTWTLALTGEQLAGTQGQHEAEAVISVKDSVGNEASAQAKDTYAVDTVIEQTTLTLADVTDNNIIEAAEAGGNITLSGKVSGEFSQGDTVTLGIGDQTAEASLNATGDFSVDVAATVLLANDDKTINASVEVHDAAGNSQTITATDKVYAIEDSLVTSVHIDAVGNDGVVGGNPDAQWVRLGGSIDFSGSAFAIGHNKSLVKAINLKFNGKTYQAGINEENQSFYVDVAVADIQAANGKPLTYSIETADTLYTLFDNDKGDPYKINIPEKWIISPESASAHRLTMDNTTLTLSADCVKKAGADYTIDSAAVKDHLLTTISGSVSGNAKAGDTVKLMIDGKEIGEASVDAGKHFSANIETAKLAGKGSGNIEAVLTTTDFAGKAVTVSDATTYTASDIGDNAGDMVSYNGKVPYNDLPYFIQALDLQQYKEDHGDNSYQLGYLTGFGDLNSSGIPYGGRDKQTITYHFGDVAAGNAKGLDKPIDFSAVNQAVVKSALDLLSQYANIEFKAVGSTDDSMIDFYLANLNGGAVTGKVKLGNTEYGGDVTLSREFFSGENGETLDSQQGFVTTLHETLHSLGFSHPFHEALLPDATFLKPEVDSAGVSVMSYSNNDFVDSKDLRWFDLAYLHYRYGVNPEARAGNDTYSFKTVNTEKADGDIYIWDGAGVDTFDASQEANGVYVNLTPGSDCYSLVPNVNKDAFGVQGVNEKADASSKTGDGADAYDYFAGSEFKAGDTYRIAEVSLSGTQFTLTPAEIEKTYDFTEGHAFIGYGTQIENLNGSAYDDTLIGNNADNVIYGGKGNDSIAGGLGNDYLAGGEGVDTLAGGVGNDVYVVDNASDKVIEANDQGSDSVYSNIAGGYTLTDHVENLVLLQQAVAGTGNALDNQLTGNNGDNVLDGGAGADVLNGGTGSDTLTGGEGNDIFVFSSVLDGAIDTIKDFVAGSDRIQLASEIFHAADASVDLSTLGTQALLDQGYLQYDNGNLSFDNDGSAGSAEAVHFATLAGAAATLDLSASIEVV